MNSLIKIFCFTFWFLSTWLAFASDFTLKIHTEAKAESKQYCYTDFEIDLDGNWTASSMYSNGQQWNPVRFYSVLTVKSKDGRDIITIPQNYHVKGSHGGGAREERTLESGKLPDKIVRMVSKDNVGYSCNIVSDINLQNLMKAAQIASWVLSLQ